MEDISYRRKGSAGFKLFKCARKEEDFIWPKMMVMKKYKRTTAKWKKIVVIARCKKYNLTFLYPVSFCVLILGLTAPSYPPLQYSQKIASRSCRYYSAADGDTATLTAYYSLVTRAGNSALATKYQQNCILLLLFKHYIFSLLALSSTSQHNS